MKAIILAAGRGTRMKDLTDDRPKCLVELRGRALLDLQLEAVLEAGVEEIAVVTGYRREMLASRGLTEFYNSRWAETNMVSSLACAEDWLKLEPCIVSYSDIFYGSYAVKSLMKSGAPLALTYDPNWLQLWKRRFGDPLLDAETFRLTSEGTLADIGNKPSSVGEVQGQYMGLLRFTPRGWAEVARIRSTLSAAECDRIHMTGTLQMLIKSKRFPVHAIPYRGKWGEIDSDADLSVYAND